MTVVNPFTLTATSSATSTPATEASTVAADARVSAPTPVTPYDALCTDTTRPAAFTMTFREPTTAAA